MVSDVNRSPVVLADWDNTLRSGFTVISWTEFLEPSGLFDGARTLRTRLERFRRDGGDYDQFCEEMAEAYATGLAGRRQSDIIAAAKAFVSADRDVLGFVPGLLTYFRGRRLPVVVITGAPGDLMREYAATAGFLLGGTLELEVRDGVYTGTVAQNSGLHKNKADAVSRLAEENAVVFAFGDAPADRPLLDAADISCLVLTGAYSHELFPSEIVRIDPASTVEAVVDLLERAEAKT